MLVLAFNGSPRPRGNTHRLLTTVADEMGRHGITTEIIDLGSQTVNGCSGCGACRRRQDGRCAIDGDPLNQWLARMQAADGIILGSPVYCAGPTAQIKAFIDRAAMVACVNGDLFRRKVGAAVVAVRRAGAVHTFDTLNHFFTIGQMFVVGSSYWNMGFGREAGEVSQDGEGLQTMVNLARNMAWLIKCIRLAGDQVDIPPGRREVVTSFIR
ncbi:MAG: flavodoxin family protein [Negativicutes bacterium]|nr:flavodoxin family protein [Negativicutes bacterium]